jgi:hypothetical protein
MHLGYYFNSALHAAISFLFIGTSDPHHSRLSDGVWHAVSFDYAALVMGCFYTGLTCGTVQPISVVRAHLRRRSMRTPSATFIGAHCGGPAGAHAVLLTSTLVADPLHGGVLRSGEDVWPATAPPLVLLGPVGCLPCNNSLTWGARPHCVIVVALGGAWHSHRRSMN